MQMVQEKPKVNIYFEEVMLSTLAISLYYFPSDIDHEIL